MLPDAATEAAGDVDFPRGLRTYSYDAFAVSQDGAITIAASTTVEVVIVGYAPDLTRRFAVATPAEMDHAVVRGVWPRTDGGFVVAWSERDTALHEGYVVTVLSDGSFAHAIVKVTKDAYAFGVDASDRILFGTREGAEGTESGSQAVVQRLLPDGSDDADFGTAGRAVFACEGPTAAPSHRIATAADGSLFALVGGLGVQAGKRYVAKLRPDGTKDTTFGKQGCVALNGIGAQGRQGFAPNRIEVDTDGTLWLAGSVGGGSSWSHAALVKLRSDGALDTEFGAGGLVELVPDAEGNVSTRTVHKDSSGVLLLDERYLGDSKYERNVHRITPQGTPAPRPAIKDAGYLDFVLSKSHRNLYYLKPDRAGRIARP